MILKHITQTWFQDALGDRLIQTGINLYTKTKFAEKKRRKIDETSAAASVTVAAASSTVDAASATADTAVSSVASVSGPPSTHYTPTPPVRRSQRKRPRGRGRPVSTRRKRAGRPPSAPTVHRLYTIPKIVVSPVKVSFLPKIKGRKGKNPVVREGCLLIKGSRHTLRDDLPHMPRNSTCRICALTSRVKNRSRRTIYACDKCNRMLCPSCFRKQDSHKSLDHIKSILHIN